MSPIDADQVGMWDFHLNYHEAEQIRAWVAELEQLGLGSIWVGEALFRDPFTLAGILLSATTRLTVATGVTNIWVRDAFATVAAQLTLAEAYPDRFLLGVGVSHRQLVENESRAPIREAIFSDARLPGPHGRGVGQPTRQENPFTGRSESWRHWGRACLSWRPNAPMALTLTSFRLSTHASLGMFSGRPRCSYRSRPLYSMKTRAKLDGLHGPTSVATCRYRTTPGTYAALASAKPTSSATVATASWMRSSPTAVSLASKNESAHIARQELRTFACISCLLHTGSSRSPNGVPYSDLNKLRPSHL